jgi:glutamate carboxypeptidase
VSLIEVGFLKKLVDINSGTKNARGVAEVQALVEERLIALGFQIERKSASDGKIPGHVLSATKKGRQRKFISFVSHADTVFEPSTGFERFEFVGRNRAIGPGVIDDKGSILVVLLGIENYLKGLGERLPKYSFRFICTPSEETGSVGFIPILKKASRDSCLVLGFEPSLENGDIIHSRQGGRWYEVEVKGREAHAGREHREGINAVHELAIKIQRLEELTDYAKELTVNVGSVMAGTGKANVVCGFASLKLDTRFPDVKAGEKLHQKIVKILQKTHVKGAKTSFRVTEHFPPLMKDKKSSLFISSYCQILSRIEKRRVNARKSGGGADSCHMGRPGLVVIDGLGAKGGGTHTSSEWIELNSLESRSRALAEFLRQLDS